MDDRTVIKAFVTHIRAHGHPIFEIDRWPDAENNASPDIDAIADPFAIEHASVDTPLAQCQNSDWFRQAAGGLEDEFPSLAEFRFITFGISAHGRLLAVSHMERGE